MNIKQLFILFWITCSLPAAAQYKWSNPQPSGYPNNKVVFIDSVTGFIANDDGDLLKTTDCGVIWSIHKNFYGARVCDAKDSIVVVGGNDSTIYISFDTAKTWKKGYLKPFAGVEKLQIINKDTVFAIVKDFNIGITEIWQTTDGGSKWNRLNNTLIIKAIDFINSKLGYASSFGGVFKTNDGGITWANIYEYGTGAYSFDALKFLDRNRGVVCLNSGIILRTYDGGITWDTANVQYAQDYKAVQYLSPSTIIVAGEYGSIFLSTDSGNTFRPRPSAQMEVIYSTCFVNDSTGFFVGLRGTIAKTTDTANHTRLYSPTYQDFRTISFPDPLIGYAATDKEFFKTSDAGKSWIKQSIPGLPYDNISFRYAHFYTKDSGLVLTTDAVKLFKTDDGGLTWRTVTIESGPQYLEDIEGFFTIGHTIYLDTYGYFGHAGFKSMDGGETWRRIYQHPQEGIYNLFFVDEKVGYGSLGTFLYRTVDSAKTWTKISFISNYFFNSIWFTSAATGFAVGNNGSNYQTVDSGATWQRFPISPDNYNFNGIYALRFFNKKVGFFTGTGGVNLGVYKTIDGGRSWIFDKRFPGEIPLITFSPDSMLYVGGVRGIIMKKEIREYFVDSLGAMLNQTCSGRITANVGAVLSQVDSIWVEYGAGGKRRTIQSSPLSVKDSMIKTDVLIQGLSSDSIYMARIKVYYRSGYYYSDSITFKPAGLPKPVITLNGTILTSSASTGNQWFLNGVLIAGATNSTYQPVAGGTYTVQQTLNGCASAISQGINFIATAISDPVLAESIQLLPNPVNTTLWIKNRDAKKIRITIIDMGGRIIKAVQISKSEELLDVQSLSAGIYTLLLEDLKTHRKTSSKLVKW